MPRQAPKRPLATRSFTTIPGQSAVGAAAWTRPWDSLPFQFHTPAKTYSLMMNEAEQAIFAMVKNQENAYFDGKSPYTRDRSELSRDPYPVAFDVSRWMFGQFYIPRWYGSIGTGGKRPIIFQWHDTGDGGDAGGMPPPIALVYNGANLYLQYAWSSQEPFAGGFTAGSVDLGAVVANRWYTIVMRMLMPTGYQNGEVDVWLNGSLIGGTQTYRGNLGTPNTVGPYWKAGVYRDVDTNPFGIVWKGLRDSASSFLSLKDTAAPDWVPEVPF
jgi:hypothetical protein